VSAVRIEIGQLDKDLAFEQAETMAAKIQGQASALRFVAFLMGIFGLIALILCAMGVYGIVANSVTERQRDIGIRMALGAQPFHVFRNVGGKGMRLVLVGLCVGLVASLALARLLANLLYGVAAWDPSTFTEIPGLLILVALVAVYIPTRRAVGTDPVAALRQD
jgi:ABC-type antimicrobial peptide transport system permease subunit